MIETKIDFDKAISKVDNNINESINCDIFYDLGFVFNIGLFENDAYTVEIDHHKAFYWYNRASECGHLDASLRLADFLSEGLGCNKDIERSIDLYKRCIDKGSGAAANNLGVLYRDLYKYDEAFKFYEISQHLMEKEYNKPVFLLNVALCYLYGIGTAKNINMAIEQLSRLVDDKDNDYTYISEIQEAAYILGRIYLSQEKNIDKARYYLSIANEDQNHNSAQELLNIIGRY